MPKKKGAKTTNDQSEAAVQEQTSPDRQEENSKVDDKADHSLNKKTFSAE